jgi:hypothetical protein
VAGRGEGINKLKWDRLALHVIALRISTMPLASTLSNGAVEKDSKEPLTMKMGQGDIMV